MLRLHAAGLHDNDSINMCSAHNIHYRRSWRRRRRRREILQKYENYFVMYKHVKFISTFVCCARKLHATRKENKHLILIQITHFLFLRDVYFGPYFLWADGFVFCCTTQLNFLLCLQFRSWAAEHISGKVSHTCQYHTRQHFLSGWGRNSLFAVEWMELSALSQWYRRKPAVRVHKYTVEIFTNTNGGAAIHDFDFHLFPLVLLEKTYFYC